MVVVASDIKFYLSGGATNSNPHASLGGIISSHDVLPTDIVGNLFDDVTTGEASAGDTEYRCFYVKNTHASDSWFGSEVWVQIDTPSADTVIDIGADPAGIGDGVSTGVAATVANEGTAPGSVTFSHPTGSPGVSIGQLDPGECHAVWLRRTVSSSASQAVVDAATLRFSGSDV